MAAIVTDNTKPQPALYGLLSSAVTVIRDDSAHWQDKFEYETLTGAALVKLQSICSASQAVTAVEAVDADRYRTTYPFAVQTAFSCSTLSRTPAEIEDLAREYLDAAIQKAIEVEFHDGVLAKEALSDDTQFPNRWLAHEDAVDVTPTPGTGIKAKYAIALLEQALADCGPGIQGTIHVTRAVASTLNYKPKGDRLETNLGTPVVAGTGYSGAGPDGDVESGTLVWIYATGPVTVRLGPTEIVPDDEAQAVDREINTTTYQAERVAAVTWDSNCHFAVLVDLSLDYA